MRQDYGDPATMVENNNHTITLNNSKRTDQNRFINGNLVMISLQNLNNFYAKCFKLIFALNFNINHLMLH